jgi:hypothetical protein
MSARVLEATGPSVPTPVMSKCINFAVCGDEQVIPGENTCMACGPWFKVGGFGFGRLDIDDTLVECGVCTETAASVRFPQCKHRVCTACFRGIVFWDETRHHMSREPFGCPPCPNGCSNPAVGKQCYCESYDVVLDQWELEHPEAHAEWNAAEDKSIETPEVTYGTTKCPFCRAEYDRSLHGSMTGYTKLMRSSGMPPMCYVCRKPGVKKCSRCGIAEYCGAVCQRKHWLAGHRTDCSLLRSGSE